MELYSERDFEENTKQMHGAARWLWLPSPGFLAALILSLIARVQWATVLLTVLWGGLMIFLWNMKISPVRAYRRHLGELARGLHRTAEGVVVSFSPEGTYKDGVFFSTLIINGDARMEAEGERLFYVDRCKERPPLAPGEYVRVTANGNFLTAWEKRAETEPEE